MKKATAIILIIAHLFLLCACGAERNSETPVQTQVETAEYIFRDGVPILKIKGVGKVEHPAWIASYALAYMGAESYYDLDVAVSDEYAVNCINWLKKHVKETNGLKGWAYSFTSTYNNITIKAPWYSAYGQACGIEALVRWYEKAGDQDALVLAQDCAQILLTPIDQGGLLYSRDGDIWFEEIPTKEQEPSHILNGHMRACIALGLLADVAGGETVLDMYQRGVSALRNWLPLYDTGYWLRYDLNPKTTGLLFRFNDPYGRTLPELAIDEIRLTDPLTGKSVSIDVGAAPVDMDPASGAYLAGLDWQMESLSDGHTVRRLISAESESDYGVSSAKPNDYFYLDLPSEWTDNLRTDWFELTVVYKDEAPGNVVVEMRSISPDEEFVALRDGDLLMTGSGQWREWTIPLRTTDLGWPVGSLYAEKHVQYLDALTARSPELSSWATMARAYWNSARVKIDTTSILRDMQIVEGSSSELPVQSMILPLLSTDENGVVRQHYAAESSGAFQYQDVALPSEGTRGYYSPYLIAEQALGDSWALETFHASGDPADLADEYPYYGQYDWLLEGETPSQAPPEAAYRWLRENAVVAGDGLVWQMDADNCYNDLTQKAGWQSAFWQRYVIDAFTADDDAEMVRKAAYAYGVPTDEGGLCTVGRDGTLWFEEVPNDSHILNADIASIVALQHVLERYPDVRVQELYETGLNSLRGNLYRYDTGYWTRYDANPQKNILYALQFDGSDLSPEIDTIWLYDPAGNAATELAIGDEGDAEGASRISGNLWLQERAVDGRMARKVYPAKNLAEEAYFTIALPESGLEDSFDLSSCYFLIRYKDTSVGKLSLLSQSIANGNTLVMQPLRQSGVDCVGDGAWKTAVIELRPQDTGWYMGPDYQAYHNEQLSLIAEKTGDWYFTQTVEKWTEYLDRQNSFDPRQVFVEGSNRTVFTDTQEQKALYIPQTSWREEEYSAQPELCEIRLLSVSGQLEGQSVKAFLSGQRPQLRLEPGDSFLVELNGAHQLTEIELERGDGGVVTVSCTGMNPKVYFSLPFYEGGTQTPEENKLCAFLQIKCPQEAAQGVDLDKISAFGIPALSEQVLRAVGEDTEVMTATDPDNPLLAYRIPIQKSVYGLAERLLKGTGDLTEHQKIMVFMDYISEWYIGVPQAEDYLALRENIGACGVFSNLLAALAATQGIRARLLTLGNYPINDGHAVCEMYYDGSWHLYDPTYGAYYTTTPRDTATPRVLSFEELSGGAGNSSSVTCVVTSPHRITGPNSYSFLGPAIYEAADPKGPVSPDYPLVYPLWLDLAKGVIKEDEFGAAYQGITFIGAAFSSASQRWTLTGLEAGKTYEFTAAALGVMGENSSPFDAVCDLIGGTPDQSLSTHSFDNASPSSMIWKIRFTAQTDSTELLLTHSYYGPEFHYVFFSSFALEEVS